MRVPSRTSHAAPRKGRPECGQHRMAHRALSGNVRLDEALTGKPEATAEILAQVIKAAGNRPFTEITKPSLEVRATGAAPPKAENFWT